MNHVDNPFKSPAVLSLCTGMRGLESGIERAIGPIRTVAFVEIEAFVIENLVRQMEQGVLAPAPVWSDLKTFPAAAFHNKIHGITGGYPCQPFSVAGKRAGTDDPRHLWPHIRSIIDATRPVWCFFENVPGHLTIGYQQVRSDLQSLGYTVTEGLFSAQEVGAPHQRIRLFILAVADSEIIRMEGNRTKGLQISETHERSGLSMRESGTDRWPAPPGQPQHPWEAPRVESSLGFTFNGYSFREDLLRLLGNGVVESTAELAFKTLLQKHNERILGRY